MKALIWAIIILTAIYMVGGKALRAYFTPESKLPNLAIRQDALPTMTEVSPTPTTEPIATPQPTPTLTHDEPRQMRFAIGTYGGTYDAGTWSLWAAQGQTITLAGDDMDAVLTTQDGTEVALVAGKTTLPVSGDYLLTVVGVEKFSVDIR